MEDLARNLFSAIEADDMDKAMSYLSDDFQFSGPVPEPLGGKQWIGLQHALKSGMPDWSFNVSDVKVDGSQANVTIKISGTHNNDLDLTPLGVGVIPATGKAVQLPEELAVLTITGDKISSLVAEVTEDGGIGGILKQLGVEPPPQ